MLKVLDVAYNHFLALDGAYWLTKEEVEHHEHAFVYQYFNPDKLDKRYGYSQELALTAQLDEYCRENFGWTHPNEGM